MSFTGNETPPSHFLHLKANLISFQTLVHLFIQHSNYAYGRHMDLNSAWFTIC